MRSRVTGMRLAIGFGVSSLVVAPIGPSVKAAGFPTLLMVLVGRRRLCTVSPSRFCPTNRQTRHGGAEARRVSDFLRQLDREEAE